MRDNALLCVAPLVGEGHPDHEAVGRAAVEATARTLPPPESDVDLGNAIGVLPPMQRAAVVMHYFDDLPVADIARILVVSESTVKQHLYRARHRLADLLGEEVAADDVHR
jgi:RNA polymerase sigma-70 factor (ECF subfamily)